MITGEECIYLSSTPLLSQPPSPPPSPVSCLCSGNVTLADAWSDEQSFPQEVCLTCGQRFPCETFTDINQVFPYLQVLRSASSDYKIRGQWGTVLGAGGSAEAVSLWAVAHSLPLEQSPCCAEHPLSSPSGPFSSSTHTTGGVSSVPPVPPCPRPRRCPGYPGGAVALGPSEAAAASGSILCRWRQRAGGRRQKPSAHWVLPPPVAGGGEQGTKSLRVGPENREDSLTEYCHGQKRLGENKNLFNSNKNHLQFTVLFRVGQ